MNVNGSTGGIGELKRILLAEDEEVLRMLIIDTLESSYSVDEAADGKEAVEKLSECDYDLIIVDNMMPIMTGLEVIQHVRRQDHLKNKKILMLSAKSQSHEQQEILDAGADYFMAKPFSPFVLLEKIGEILDEN